MRSDGDDFLVGESDDVRAVHELVRTADGVARVRVELLLTHDLEYVAVHGLDVMRFSHL